jgi:predicted ATP-binding protein involved in virulence
MIHIKNLTVKNFMSVGNATQAIDFDRKDLTLVLGENLDLGGDGSRNGTGKTTIINAAKNNSENTLIHSRIYGEGNSARKIANILSEGV